MKWISVLLIGIIFSTATAFSQERWSPWEATYCYEDIHFRTRYVKALGDRHEWEIEFKNRYNRMVVFNYGILEGDDDDEYPVTTHRKTLKAFEICDPVVIYTQAEGFIILVDQLSFYVDSREIVPCEEEE